MYQPRQPFVPAYGPQRGRGRGRGRGMAMNRGHFECKVCDKEYKTKESYDTHLESHQKVRLYVFAL